MFRLGGKYLSKSAALVVAAGSVGFVGYQLWSGGERFHREVAMPIVHRLFDPETSHRLAVSLIKNNLLPMAAEAEYTSLRCHVWNITFDNPICLAAGFDKDADAVDGLCSRSGFGAVEIGTVTPQPQPGNDKPRVFRLPQDRAVINRYGFNSDGHVRVMERVRYYRSRRSESAKPCVLGINVGKNKTSEDAHADYCEGISTFLPFADYLVINVSSPNTPGLRDLQDKHQLQHLLTAVAATRRQYSVYNHVPLLLKVSPDLTAAEKADIADVCLNKQNGIDGLIVANTTVSRPASLKSPLASEQGGLSGPPLRQLSTESIADFYRLLGGKVPIVGCGGVADGQDAYEKIRAGATLVQLYTVVVYQGFPVVGRIKRELAELLKRDGFDCVNDAIGVDARKASSCWK